MDTANPFAYQGGSGGLADAPKPVLDKAGAADLINARRRLARNDPRHTALAPAEHRAFAREWTAENPLVAPLSLAVAIPAYTAAKAIGLTNARSPASLAEISEGYKGIWDGLRTRFGALQ